MARNVASGFIAVSVVYFLIGAFWMGFGPFFAEPQQAFAQDAYNWARVHVMVLGWASLAILGMLYYLAPRIAGKEEMHSERLGIIHFWLTNVTFAIGLFLVTYGSFVMDPLLSSGMTESEVTASASVAPIYLGYFVVFLIGFAAQFVFVYNLFRTLRKKGVAEPKTP